MPRKLVIVLVSILTLGGMQAVIPATAAADGPVFTVMNTSETQPDGVWFRRSAHTDDTDRVTGHGVYANEQVQLHCYAWGDSVGQYDNRLWYFVDNVTRPTNAGSPNNGFLNAHYIDDGLKANEIDAGVPPCDGGQQQAPPPIPEGASAFFQPRGHHARTPASINVEYGAWAPGGCRYGSGAAPDPFGGRWISTLAGWSNGRLGPVYFLAAANREQRSHVHYVLLIDPGRGDVFRGSCDASTHPSRTLADWLSLPGSRHLMIISAEATARDNHKGLQQYYLADIKRRHLNKHVLVCNDDGRGHESAFTKYAADPHSSYIASQKLTCPRGIRGWQP
ncbi:MAG: hypothetical protein QOH76_3965 [Thermoleophilaceae bacterium]|jgi:hypothetical protein|nr:hypothetical protein [Thermoleophilaceae bacterium]